MDEQIVRRTRRTPQQKADEIDIKIQKLNQELASIEEKRNAANQEFDKKVETVKERMAALEQRKTDILTPHRKPRKTKKQKIQDLIKMASKSGLKPEEIAQRLGLDLAEE